MNIVTIIKNFGSWWPLFQRRVLTSGQYFVHFTTPASIWLSRRTIWATLHWTTMLQKSLAVAALKGLWAQM